MKQWDSCVFGSEVRSTSDDVLSALRRHSSIAHHKKITFPNFSRKFRGQRWSEGSFRHSNNLELENSNSKGIQDLWNKHTRLSGPPEQKVSYIFETYLFPIDRYLVLSLTVDTSI